MFLLGLSRVSRVSCFSFVLAFSAFHFDLTFLTCLENWLMFQLMQNYKTKTVALL